MRRRFRRDYFVVDNRHPKTLVRPEHRWTRYRRHPSRRVRLHILTVPPTEPGPPCAHVHMVGIFLRYNGGWSTPNTEEGRTEEPSFAASSGCRRCWNRRREHGLRDGES